MGAALELLTGRAVAPGTTFTKLTMDPPGSETVRNAPIDRRIWLLQAWADNQAAGTLRIRSPRLHDNVQGLRLDIVAGVVQPLLPWGYPQRLVPQDTLTLEITGSAVAGDLEQAAFLVYYQDLPGVSARFIDTPTLRSRMVNLFTVENTITPGTTGGFTGEEAIKAEFDLFKANTDYALVGYLVDTECCAVRWRGADTGNLGVGGPGEPDLRFLTKDWFAHLSDRYGVPLIPVFNSANKEGILVDIVQDEDAAAVTVTSIFAELGAGGT
jgi:hypothetical protein